MTPLVKVPFRYGAIAGVLGLVLTITLYYTVAHPLLIPPYLDFRIFVLGVFIYFSARELRDYYFGGVLYFWQGMIASLILTLVFALIGALGLQIFMQFNDGFLTSYIRLVEERMREIPPEMIESIGKDVFERNLALLPSTNPSALAFTWFAQSLVISFFISIVLSVILRRQPKT